MYRTLFEMCKNEYHYLARPNTCLWNQIHLEVVYVTSKGMACNQFKTKIGKNIKTNIERIEGNI